MYSSSSVSKRHALVPILVVVNIQFLLIRSVSSLNTTNEYLHHTCFVNQGKYNPGSKYEKDLKNIIKTIPHSNFSRGLEMMSFGKGPSFVSVTHMCPNAALALPPSSLRRCSRYKGGIIWYDQCLLVISAIDSFGKIDYDNNFCMSNAKNYSVGQYSNTDWMTLISNLTTKAMDEKNPSPLHAVGERKFGKEKLYGMVQCMQDISSKGCEECVSRNIVKFQECLFYKRGARVIGRSCNIRYEFYPFIASEAGHKYLKT